MSASNVRGYYIPVSNIKIPLNDRIARHGQSLALMSRYYSYLCHSQCLRSQEDKYMCNLNNPLIPCTCHHLSMGC